MSECKYCKRDVPLECADPHDCILGNAASELSEPVGDFTGLLSAAKTGAKWMRFWLDNNECDCEYGHSCGKTERERELEQIEMAIAKAEGR